MAIAPIWRVKKEAWGLTGQQVRPSTYIRVIIPTLLRTAINRSRIVRVEFGRFAALNESLKK